MAIWLSEKEVKALLAPDELIETLSSALAAFSRGEVEQPLRTVLQPRPQSWFASMPMASASLQAVGTKLVSVFPGNAARHLPTHLATILLFDPESGMLRAVMDGRYITEARTAAVSAISVQYLAPENARTLAIIGSGVQARSHLRFLSHVHRFEAIRCWSPRPESRARFAEGHAAEFPALTPCETAGQAMRDADVIVLATSSPVPVIAAAWVKPGAHVISVGACRPHERELDPELLAAARLFVDSRESALRESGDVVMAIAEGRIAASHIVAELGELIARTVPYTRAKTDITILKPLGLAVEDVTAAALAYRKAIGCGVGTVLE
jgi:ornithine cyclodeaminase/alanine dehydrogenase-like protein (mu-crystallin family)